jgi:uncharacterized protein
MAVIFGSVAGGAWETVLRWMNGVEFGVTDPQFNRDVAFYVFDLPAYHFFHGWALGLVIVSALAAGAVYGLTFSLQRFELNITRGMRIHLSILGGVVLLLIAVSTFLGIFDLVANAGGIVYGATYTDVNARLPVRYVLVALAAFAGVATILNAFLSQNSFRIPIFAFGLWAFAGIVGGIIYPQMIQRFQVDPNELDRERPYIARNIEATRDAWQLNEIDIRSHPANPVVTGEEIDANPETLANIRLLDPIPMRETLNQIQAIRPFYRFRDIDISRYPLGGENDRQVLVAARELDLSRAGSLNWTQQRLQFTHGFGAVVTPVNEVDDSGLPTLITQDIPPRSESLPISIQGSRIYFGELTDHYVIVNTNVAEFDYPVGEGGQEVTRYEEDRGIVLSNPLRRFVLSWDLADFNVLISGQIQNDSRLLLHRNIQERVAKVAPFLLLDGDPYVAIIDDRLQWIQPAYTVADTYPYSQPRGGVNYVRNSVQIVTDAITGDMSFYLVDETDPIAQTWAGIFPDLFTPDSEMPEEIRQQLRYPLDLFRIQAQHYQVYHITDPDTFFFQEDVWEIPVQTVGGRDQRMEPYYVTMSLPGEEQVEYVLILPFTPRDRPNTIAWLAGRSDGEHFGTMRAFRFPADRLIFGPRQIENRIDQNALISQQMTLWQSGESEVQRTTLMMIPVGDSFLYVQPVYLQAAGGQLPELRRVIVANGNAVAMEPSFEEALEVVLGERAPSEIEGLPGDVTLPLDPDAPAQPTTPAPAQPTPVPPGTVQNLDEIIQQLRVLLDQLEAQLNQP